MVPLELVIGNKNYSSWSMRPWLALKAFDVAFTEIQVQLKSPGENRHLLEHSPSEKVPVLKHGDLTIWDSMAILEYVAELHPDKRFWPIDRSNRAMARVLCAQMHSGFFNLRNECPMNMRREHKAIAVSDSVKDEVKQIEQLWRTALDASKGPFLFGAFTIADAMFAPVVNRLLTYKLVSDETILTYCQAMTSHPAWIEWAQAAKAEKWVMDYAEL